MFSFAGCIFGQKLTEGWIFLYGYIQWNPDFQVRISRTYSHMCHWSQYKKKKSCGVEIHLAEPCRHLKS